MTGAFVAFGDAARVREEAKHFDSFVFFGSRTQDGGGPQMYMNLVDPGTELAAHFHRVDQFQVFFGTPGSVFQRKPIPPLFVHYTDAYSTYGPFRAAPGEPLLYATIRAESSNFGGVMPGARHQRPYLGDRQLSAAVEGWEQGDLPPSGRADVDTVLDQEADGLGAVLVRLGPDTSTELPLTQAVSGRALCVVTGDLRLAHATRRYGARSLGWIGPDHGPVTVPAGPEGCAVLVLNFPSPATKTTRAAAAEAGHGYREDLRLPGHLRSTGREFADTGGAGNLAILGTCPPRVSRIRPPSWHSASPGHLPPVVTPGQAMARMSMSATQAGFAPPSISQVNVMAIWTPPFTSVTELMTAPIRTLESTGTGEGKRILS